MPEIVVARGLENMSLSPHLLAGSRDGQRGNASLCIGGGMGVALTVER